jgi:hypothetical protein
MASVESLKNRLIDRILATKNKEFLEAIEQLFEITQTEEKIKLYPEQKEMLGWSEKDIEFGNILSEAELDKLDSEWLDSKYFGHKLL